MEIVKPLDSFHVNYFSKSRLELCSFDIVCILWSNHDLHLQLCVLNLSLCWKLAPTWPCNINGFWGRLLHEKPCFIYYLCLELVGDQNLCCSFFFPCDFHSIHHVLIIQIHENWGWHGCYMSILRKPSFSRKSDLGFDLLTSFLCKQLNYSEDFSLDMSSMLYSTQISDFFGLHLVLSFLKFGFQFIWN